MRLTITWGCLTVLSFGSVGTAWGQESLRNVVEEQGFAWMIGSWQATMDNGTTLRLKFAWAAGGHAILNSFDMGSMASQSLIYFVPETEEVRQLTVDSRGRRAEGTWEPQGLRAVLKTQLNDAQGNTVKAGITYTQVDAKTMRVGVYGLEYGELVADPWFRIDYRRQAP